MSTATLSAASGAVPAADGAARARLSAPSRKGAFARFLDRIVEVRLRKTEAEIRRYHAHLLPDEVDRRLGNLPFVR
jgi:hypothetical protein